MAQLLGGHPRVGCAQRHNLATSGGPWVRWAGTGAGTPAAARRRRSRRWAPAPASRSTSRSPGRARSAIPWIPQGVARGDHQALEPRSRVWTRRAGRPARARRVKGTSRSPAASVDWGARRGGRRRGRRGRRGSRRPPRSAAGAGLAVGEAPDEEVELPGSKSMTRRAGVEVVPSGEGADGDPGARGATLDHGVGGDGEAGRRCRGEGGGATQRPSTRPRRTRSAPGPVGWWLPSTSAHQGGLVVEPEQGLEPDTPGPGPGPGRRLVRGGEPPGLDGRVGLPLDPRAAPG